MANPVKIENTVGDPSAPVFHQEVNYDDVSRDVTTFATGRGFGWLSVKVTATLTRTIAYVPPGGGTSVDPELAALMAAADFTVPVDGNVVVLAANVNPNAVSRSLAKNGGVDGLDSSFKWSGR